MSFSTDIKNEVTRLDSSKLEYIAELSAILRNSATFENNIKIVLENNAVARRIFKLFKDIYNVIPIITVRKKYNFHKGYSYILEINQKNKEILKDLSLYDNTKYLNVPKEYIISDEDSIRAYLRGVFLTTGSVNDPKTSRYHLEFMIDNLEYANFINNLINNYRLISKIIKKEKKYMIYIKEAERISDFLRIIKAYSGVMYFEDIRIYRDHKNMTNRLNNCEQANMDKIFLSSNKMIQDINRLKELDLIDLFDDKVKEAIDYRIKYPEASLQELSEIMTEETGKPITKSGLNHRFRKIKEMVDNLDKKH